MNLREVWRRAEARYPYLAELRPVKTRYLFAVYDELLDRLPPEPHILELGIYRGGSIALWNETFPGARIVGVDLAESGSAPGFERYLAESGAAGRIAAHWETSQADAEALRGFVATELGGRLDLVIDDASHVYSPTAASLEALLPLVSPGGFYLVEDWGTDYFPAYADAAGKMVDLVTNLSAAVQGRQRDLTRLVASACCFYVEKRGGPGLGSEPWVDDDGSQAFIPDGPV